MSTWILTVALLGAQTSAPLPKGTAGTEVVRELLSRRSEFDQRTDKDLVNELAQLGPDLAPTLLALVSGEALDEFFSTASEASGPDLICSPDRIGDLALGALAAMPPANVLACVRASEARTPTLEMRLAHARALGALRNASGLELLFEIVTALEKELASPSVRAPVLQALAAVLSGDARSFHALEELQKKLPEEALVLCAEALEATARPEGAAILGRFLERGGALEILALNSLAELERRFPWRLHVDVRPQIRARLESPDPVLRRAAVIALAQIHDTDGFLLLIARLEDPEPKVSEAALWALQSMADTESPRTPAQWAEWLEEEQAWWSSEGERLRQELAGPDPARALTALRALSLRRFGKHDVADEVGDRLSEFSSELQRVACDTLAGLGSTHCVPALVEVLFDEDRAARISAWKALQVLTEEPFGPEPRVWEAYAFD